MMQKMAEKIRMLVVTPLLLVFDYTIVGVCLWFLLGGEKALRNKVGLLAEMNLAYIEMFYWLFLFGIILSGIVLTTGFILYFKHKRAAFWFMFFHAILFIVDVCIAYIIYVRYSYGLLFGLYLQRYAHITISERSLTLLVSGVLIVLVLYGIYSLRFYYLRITKHLKSHAMKTGIVMYCSQCGHRLKKVDGLYCSQCGAPIKKTAREAVIEVDQSNVQDTSCAPRQ